ELATVTQHDGTVLRLRKLAQDYDPTDRIRAMNYLQERAAKGEVVTGLLYVRPHSTDLHEHLNTVDTPLARLTERDLCPGAVALERINAALR
ncbi:MAG: 2-oxoacid:ferredoxin oxidoreductase subunit beta, partial [Betaproteobacteria bacterium]|nr:2-oxoacid:ferredoxin oxidoreductase subunit beta [Betaproteobacteria bacterium]